MQSLHVGMQPPGHFSTVIVIRNNVKTSILEFCRERECQSMNHFNVHAAGKTKKGNLYMSYTNKKRQNRKLKIQQLSLLTFPS